MNKKNMKRNEYLFFIRFMLCTPTEDMSILICKLCYMYTVIEDHCLWSYLLSVFPLSYKVSTSVLFV